MERKMGRAPRNDKVGLKKGRWTAEEDDILTKYIQTNGEGSWRTLPEDAGLSRCGKSCRLRWINYLRANLKRGNITPAEEETIVKLHNALGNRWSFIAGHLPGRTDNEIKNYWNTHLSRKLYSFTRTKNESLSTILNLAAACKPRGWGRSFPTTRPHTKKLKNTASNTVGISLAKPAQSGTTSTRVLEYPTTKEKADDLPDTILEQVEKNPTMGMGSWGLEQKWEVGRNLGIYGPCLDNTARILSQCDGSKRGELSPNIESDNSAVVLRPFQTQNGENEALEPYEWLDGEMMRLTHILESAQIQVGNVAPEEPREKGVNAALGTEQEYFTSEEIKESSTVLTSSNAGGGECYACSSSINNAGFDDEWLGRNWVDGVGCHNQGAICDEGDKMLTCLWEADKSQAK
ncbi:hypothetical protein F2P56_014779 [Juglans regia]|uniref:Transcription factor MYB111-like n=3 Tax=Juglans regia TaxID=51240 RepID=A0A834CN77_JUGRE|nr:transcription factor MYB15-like [Juglans regia]KAF5464725.1 hypothetical protein F2P56_014779 [Juglans regia]